MVNPGFKTRAIARRAASTATSGIATFGAMAAGVALLDVALVPALVLGGAAALIPGALPSLRRPTRTLLHSMFGPRAAPAVPAHGVASPGRAIVARSPAGVRPTPLARFGLRQSVAKTITFRIIVTTLDFTTNYVVIGDLATSAGLSGFSLVVGPLFYLLHETGWNYFGPATRNGAGVLGPAIDVPIAPITGDADAMSRARKRLTISRALAKTITFRTMASTMEFTTNYVVVQDLGTAALLSATGLILGPFVYLGHEMAWERYGPRALRVPGTAAD